MTKPTRRGFFAAAGAAAAATVLPLPKALAEGETRPNSKVKFSLGMASYSLRKFPLDEAVKMTKRLALDYICLKSFHLPMNATEEACAAAAKTCSDGGVKLYGGGVIKMSNAEEVDNAFRYAKAAGMSTIVGVPYEDVLPLVEKKVQETDICVAIHNHGPGDNRYTTPEIAYEKIKGLDPRIGLCIDIGHVKRLDRDPVAAILACKDRLLDMHFKDVTAAAKEGKSCPAGRGVIDLVAVLKTLIEIGYDRVASFEYESESGDPLPGLAETAGYVRGILAAL